MKRLPLYLFLCIFACNLQAQKQGTAGWHHSYSDSLQGSRTDIALRYLNALGLKPQQRIVVGVVDDGIDTTVTDLKNNLWINAGEHPDGKDSDGNGYIDDVHGWNFLGTKDGSFTMVSAGTEEYREFKRLYPKYKEADTDSTFVATNAEEYAYYLRMRKKAGINSYLTFYQFCQNKQIAYETADSILKAETGAAYDTLTLGGFKYLDIENKTLENALTMLATDLLKASNKTLWKQLLENSRNELDLMTQRITGIEHDKDKRLLLGDDLENADDRFYGNPILKHPEGRHGTIVSGIIAGQGFGNPAARGIYPEACIMAVQAIPAGGDEYDKDVASAIRYAVDNGAKVINMSFGKHTSPRADMTTRVLEYARLHDVLLVAAAGNNHFNIDSVTLYPLATDSEGHRLENLIRVGASDMKGHCCSFSNYGANEVDLFAPGQNILSVDTGGVYTKNDGTSMAAPIVSGIAAMIRSYFPELTAGEVKKVLMETARPMEEKALSRSGGIIDALAAVKRARKMSHEKVWARAERLSADSLESKFFGKNPYPDWIDDSHYFHYNITDANGEKQYYLVSAKDGKPQHITGEENIKKLRRGEWFGPRKERKGFEFNMVKDNTADSAFTIMGCGYDLYVRNNRTGSISRLTEDGKEGASYTYRATKDTVTRTAVGFWLDHIYISFIQDQSEIKTMSLIHSLDNERPVTETFKMPMPGDKGVKRYKIFWYDADKGEGRLLPIDKYADQTVTMDYYRSSTALYIVRRSRKGDKVDLSRINVKEGTVETLIEEETQPHINLTLFNHKILEHGKYIIWWSERTGRGNYYLYDGNGRLLNRITQGDNLIAGSIAHIDTLRREMIFAGYGNAQSSDPCYTCFYKVKLNGKKQTLLTPGDGMHDLMLSKDGRYAIDRYSRVDRFPRLAVFSVDNPQKRFEVMRADSTRLIAAGWKAPQLVKVKAADNTTDLYGIMYTPSNLDTTRTYPVIANVYPGPQDDQMARSFTIDDNNNQSLAELGFVVVNIAPRGSSPWRGKDFYCFSYGQMRDYPLADNKYAIEQLAARCPYMDLSRVGIYGHSGGGFMAAASILTYPDFYKVALAASGNHDNNIYIQWFGEAFHGVEETTDSLTGEKRFAAHIPTNMELAGNLKGRLMLVTGDVDKNVPPSNTYRLADALIRQGKRFDMMVMPGKDHGLNSPYYKNLIRYYFMDHLMQLHEEDTDIINHQ